MRRTYRTFEVTHRGTQEVTHPPFMSAAWVLWAAINGGK